MSKLFMVFMLCLALLMPMTVSAAVIDPDTGIAPCWEYMEQMDVELTFSGTSGKAEGSVNRIFGVTTQLSGTLTVYKKVGTSWVYVNSISNSSTRMLSMELSFSATKNVEYKAVFSVTAYGNGGSESDSVSTTKICPSN